MQKIIAAMPHALEQSSPGDGSNQAPNKFRTKNW